jgi:hypothetical protein
MSLQRSLSRLAKQLRRDNRQASGTRSFHQGTVVAIDVDEGTAEVEIGSGAYATTVTIQKQAGFLPAVGETVMMAMNGAEPIVNAPTVMVEGDMQSKNFEHGESGWRIMFNGDAEFNNAEIRGILKTGGSSGPYILIQYDSDTDTHQILFDDGLGPLNSSPAIMSRNDFFQWFRMNIVGPASPFSALPFAGLALYGADIPAGAADYNFMHAEAPLHLANGNNTSKPAMYLRSRSSNQSISHDTWSALATFNTILQRNMLFQDAAPFAPSDVVSYSAGIWTINRDGLYRVSMEVVWQANGTGHRSIKMELNGSTDIPFGTDPGHAIGSGSQICHAVKYRRFTAGDTVGFRHYQNAGGAINVEGVFGGFEYLSD